MKSLSDAEAELKMSVAYKKKCVIVISTVVRKYCKFEANHLKISICKGL